MINKVSKSLKINGFLGTLFFIIRYFFSKINITIYEPIVQRQLALSAEINELLHSTVAYGPFSGLKLSENIWWGKSDRANMLLGLYEKEILDELIICSHDRELFIDIGAADGYFGIGVVYGGLFERSICYEMSSFGRELIRETASKNGVLERVKIFGVATKDFCKDFSDDDLKKAVVLMDIEGGEFDLLDLPTIKKLSKAIIYVELHDQFFPDGADKLKKLLNNLEKFFVVSEITTGARDLSCFSCLRNYSDNDRWLIASESRPFLMTWLKLVPHRVG